MGSEAVLDASAILALLLNEPGHEAVAALLPGAAVSAVNLSEVVSKLSLDGMPEPMVRRVVKNLGLVVENVDEELAYSAGTLRPWTRKQGLSLGDRVCLALAERLGVPAWTSDRIWSDVDIPGRPIEVRQLR